MAVRAVISDFGGVLTSPLSTGFAAVQDRWSISPAQFGAALAALTAARRENPLYALETGTLDEPGFLAVLGSELADQLGESVSLDGFGEAFFGGLSLNEPFLAYLRECHEQRGTRLAICTNNVREWSQRWRAMVPDPGLFDVVVDSSEVGLRKPDPRIYALVLDGLGLTAPEAVFVDDLEVNCTAAAQLGMHSVWFRDTEQAIAEVRSALSA